MSKANITVTMPIEDYENLKRLLEHYQNERNKLHRIILRYSERGKGGVYSIKNVYGLANDMEEYIRDYDAGDLG